MEEKMNFVRDNYDDLRKAILYEPRGHYNMFGAIIICEHCNPKADFGVILHGTT
jgi:proline racemase